jgi:hypothetical protein
MFALLWRLPREPFNQDTWSAEAEAGVPYHRIHGPSHTQEAEFIATEPSFMRNEWASARADKVAQTSWKQFVTSAYNNTQF